MLSSWRSVISSRIFWRIFWLKTILHGLLWLLTSSGAFWNYKNKVSPAASRILDDIIKHKQFYTYGKQYSADDIYKWIILNDLKSNKNWKLSVWICPNKSKNWSFYAIKHKPKEGLISCLQFCSKMFRQLLEFQTEYRGKTLSNSNKLSTLHVIG